MARNPSKAGEWKKRESFGSALVQIAVVALVLAVGVALVYRRGVTKKELSELMRQARAAQVKGNYTDLKDKTLPLVEQALAKDERAGDPNAFAAAVYTDLWQLHHEPGADALARGYLDKAKAAGAQTEERFGVEAQQLLAQGDAKGAADLVEELRKKGGSGARLLYAQAMAFKAQGNLPLARTGLTAAMDKAWRDGNYACAWGELILEEGVPGAVDTFTKAVSQNPELLRARLGLALARVQKRERLGEAEALLNAVLAKGAELSAPQKARAQAIGAGLALIREQPEAAVSLADQALSLNPDDAWAAFYKASALAARKEPAAVQAFEAAVKKAPWAPVFYFEGALKLQRAGFGEAAMQLLAQYEAFFKHVKNATADGQELAWLERDDRYWLARGELLEAAGKPDEALSSYDRAIAAKGLNLTRAYYAKGALLLGRHDYDQAGLLLQDITPPDGTGLLPEAYLAMGEVLFSKKDWAPGCQNFAVGLTRLKATQAPRERLNEVLGDVEKRLLAANQKDLAKAWLDAAKPLIQ